MKSLPTQQRALQKRHALIAAANHEFSTVGFEVATAKSIAAAAGVATGTFYQYFENKNDILCVIATQRFEHLQKKILSFEAVVPQMDRDHQQSAIESLFHKTLQLVFDFHSQAPELHQVLEQRRELDPQLREIMAQGERVLRERVSEFVLSLKLANAEIVATNLFAMAEGIVHRQVFDGSGHDAEAVLQIGAKMLASYLVEHSGE